ncbi:hypothetical protein K438DRAFT_1771264 [Mycena galopus ATCC 62051]|nr:hypothetical protein K438DRAFT_1771264 [Mycena galopus ATCC 62051]
MSLSNLVNQVANSVPLEDDGDNHVLALRRSASTTEAESTIPFFDGGPPTEREWDEKFEIQQKQCCFISQEPHTWNGERDHVNAELGQCNQQRNILNNVVGKGQRQNEPVFLLELMFVVQIQWRQIHGISGVIIESADSRIVKKVDQELNTSDYQKSDYRCPQSYGNNERSVR